MREPRFSETQIVGILQEAESGVPVPDLLRRHGISKDTFFKWLSQACWFSLKLQQSEVQRRQDLLHFDALGIVYCFVSKVPEPTLRFGHTPAPELIADALKP